MKGQAKKDFEKWYKKKTKYDFSLKYIKITCFIPNVFNYNWIMDAFNCSPESMQYGVLVDWFDSVGIYIEILRTPKGYSEFVNTLSDNVWSKTRTQARQKAIDKAVEIYNERN